VFKLRNAVEAERTDCTPPFVLNDNYNTLHSSQTYRALFSEKLELGNFPFDVQGFTMAFDFEGNDYELRGKNEDFLRIDWSNFALNEWKPMENAIDCTIHKVASWTDPSTITIQFKLERDPSSFIYKLICTSFMISSGTFVFFGTYVTDLGGRVAYIATMFLTGQAFQVVATTETPSLGYLTMLDHFLVGSNIFIWLQLFVAVFVTLCASGKDLQGYTLEEGSPGDSINIICLFISTIFYIIFVVAWSLYAYFVSIPTEKSKLLSTPLKIPCRGFLYVLTYLDNHTPELRESTSRRETESESLDCLQEKITRIVRKNVAHGKSVIQSLTNSKLATAVQSFKDFGCVMTPPWKVDNMEKKRAKTDSKRQRKKSKQDEMRKEIVYVI